MKEGATLAEDGVVRFRRVDLKERIARAFGIELHERSVGKLLRRLGYRKLSVRPLHPQTDLAPQVAFIKTSPTWRTTRSARSTPASPSKSGSKMRPGLASKAR